MSNEEIVKQIQKGINSGDNMGLLYQKNDGFIRKLAKRYSFLDDINDLMQEAYFGLYQAVQKYEDTAGVLFMSYAAFWIRQSMTRYLETNGRTVKIPSGLHTKVFNYKKAITAYEMQLGRKPTDDELCRCLRVNNNVLNTIIKAFYQFGEVKSLDEPIPGNDDEDILLGDGVADQNTNVEDDAINRVIVNRLHNELWQIVKDNTTEEENNVIKARYIKSLSLEATGHSIGKNRDAVRAIEARALRKLRFSKVRRELEEKFEVNYARVYRGNLSTFKYTGTSIIEDIALRNLERQEIF